MAQKVATNQPAVERAEERGQSGGQQRLPERLLRLLQQGHHHRLEQAEEVAVLQHADRTKDGAGNLGFGRIVVSEIEVPILLVNLV
jgi:hypothetical protein